MPRLSRVLLAALPAMLLAGAAAAQSVTLDMGAPDGTPYSGRIIQLVLLTTAVTLAPSLLVTVTSFTRIAIVLSLLRSALGLQQTPPNTVLTGLALFMTLFVMQPVLERSWTEGVAPMMAGKVSEIEGVERAVVPLREFMLRHVRDSNLEVFRDLAKVPDSVPREAVPLKALVPAFMISEISRAFEIGFLVFVPFLVIDMAIATILMAMGMMMLPPATVALPLKVIFFVLIDGWAILSESLVKGFL